MNELEYRIIFLEKELKKSKEEIEVWKKEIKEAYKYNILINKWWKFKLERAVLEARNK